MNNYPLVSIGIPVYNCEKEIAKVITFFVNQSYKNIEIIISDNNSNDNTASICKKFEKKNKKIKFFKQEENFGSVKNLNFVLSKSKGEYFMFACHDDMWDENFIYNSVKILENNTDAVACTGNTKIYDQNKNLIVHYTPDHQLNEKKFKRVCRFLKYNYGDHLTFSFLRRNVIKNFALDTRYFSPEILFIFKLLCEGKIISSNKLNFYKYEDFYYNKMNNTYLPGTYIQRQEKQYRLKNNFFTRHGMMLSMIILIPKNFKFFEIIYLYFLIIFFKNRFARLINKYDMKPSNYRYFFKNNH